MTDPRSIHINGVRIITRQILLLALILLMTTATISQERYSKIRIPVSSAEDIRAIARMGIAVDHVGGRTGRWVDLFVSGQEIALLRENGVRYTTLIDDWKAEYRARLQRDEEMLARNVFAPPVQNFHLGSMGGHLTLAEVQRELDSMYAKYPTLITRRDSIGSSIEHRPIWWVKISKNAAVDEGEPCAFYNALIHAREPAGMMTLIYFMWYLLENYGTDPEVTSLLDTRELFFVPVVNADGYAYNQLTDPAGGGMWRKNRRFNAGGTYGIDLNRNYGFQWGYDNVGSSSSPGSEVYRGIAPFSEPETDAVRALCIARGFSVALNYHTFGNLLIYPWGYLDTDTEDSVTFRRMGEEMTAVSRNTYGTGGQTVGYVTNGSSDDWMYGDTQFKSRIFSMTPEVGDELDGFWALPSRILPIARENLPANLYLAHAAGEFLAVSSMLVHDNPAADSLRIELTLINKGQTQSSSTVDIVAQSPDLDLLTPSITGAPWQGVPIEIAARKKTPWSPGQKVRIDLRIAYQGGLTVDTVIFRLGPSDTIYTDDAETTRSRWISASNTATKWDTTSRTAHSGRYSFTDSRLGNYPDNLSSTFLLDTMFTLAGLGAELRFWTKWHIETNYDCATVEASVDGGATWTPLSGFFTGKGSGAGTQVPEFSPGYDGIKHDWVEEVIDLDQCVGQTIAFRFRMQSDSYTNFDGIYIDDIRLLLYPVTANAVKESGRPLRFALGQNYPNPFNPTTAISYELAAASYVTLVVYDLLGREVARLVDGVMQPGMYSIPFNAAGRSSGVYFYRLNAGQFVETKKMVVVK